MEDEIVAICGNHATASAEIVPMLPDQTIEISLLRGTI